MVIGVVVAVSVVVVMPSFIEDATMEIVLNVVEVAAVG